MKTTDVLFLILNCGLMQAQTFAWVDQFGGALDEASYSITTDASGNVYSTGQFKGTVDFDPSLGIYNLTSAGGNDIFISKVNTSGSLVWAKRIGSALEVSGETGTSIAVGASGCVYITGTFSDTTDFDPGEGVFNLITVPYHISCPPHSNIFILKLTSAGNFIWAKHFGGDGFDQSVSLALGVNESIHLMGEVASNMNAPVDFDPDSTTFFLTSTAGAAAFVSKLDSAGVFIWADQWYSNCVSASPCGFRHSMVEPSSLTVDASGNVHCTGSFGCTVDFDPGEGIQSLSNVGGNNTFIIKLNSAGNLQWVRQFSGNSGKGNDISVDASGNVYTTGWFSNTVDFDPGPLTKNLKSFANSSDVFVSKLNASGNYVWAVQLGGTSNENGNSIDLDDNNNVYTTGGFSGTADFNPSNAKYNLKSAGGYDGFISKLNASGNFVWAVRLGGTSDEACNSIDVNGLDEIYTTGNFRGTADFDPGSGTYNLTSLGGADVFVHKLSQSASAQSPSIVARSIPLTTFAMYPNPSQERVMLSFYAERESVYEFILTDMNGSVLKSAHSTTQPGMNEYEFHFGNIPIGTYQVMLLSKAGRESKLLMIQ